MSVTLMMVSHFAQKVRCESSPPVLSTKMKNIVFYIDSLIGFCNRSGYFRVNRCGSLFLLGRFLSISGFSDIIQNGCLKRKDVGERIAKKTNCEL